MTTKEAVAKVIEARHGKDKAAQWMANPTANRMIAVYTAASIIAISGKAKADFFMSQAMAVV